MERKESFFESLGKNLEAPSVEEEFKYENGNVQADISKGAGHDPLFEEAVEVILEQGQASVSLLQRNLRMGYARAAKIMDEMKAAGIIGQVESSGTWQVLITKQQWMK